MHLLKTNAHNINFFKNPKIVKFLDNIIHKNRVPNCEYFNQTSNFNKTFKNLVHLRKSFSKT